MSFEAAIWPGWPYLVAALLTTVGWCVWRVASRPRMFRWSDHRSALAEFNRTGGRR